ncbi:hypothetical protein SAMN05216357_1282 [Porphyromonadaceae bacterium KH3CP3RA]|nr:hypothetical protein SAMN05216357_1282 [Porphyromonadaceae bacterium KH3CP3RA]
MGNLHLDALSIYYFLLRINLSPNNFHQLVNLLSQVLDFLLQPVNLFVFGREKFIDNFLGNIVVAYSLEDFKSFYSFSFFKDSNFSLSLSNNFSNSSMVFSIGKLLKVWLLLTALVFTPQFS